MQTSNILLQQKEDIGLDAILHLARFIHMHVNNKTRKYKYYKS